MTAPARVRLWADDVYEHLAQLAEPALIEDARSWLAEHAWAGRSGVEIWSQTMPATSVLKGLHRHFPGGIAAYTRAWMADRF